MQTVQFPAKFEFLDEIREFVGNIARENGFNDQAVYHIQLAADEAASNVIEHAYGGGADGMLEISCGVKAETLIIILVDHGKSFDPSEVPLPDIQADLGDRKIGGLGIFLMRKLMDEFEYVSSAHSNTLKMTKRKA
ncbi:MAG TPA: ATP-binding protein [Anaerolineales bacterium]|nr:ATP-binding protein [Anaerolineales bacterium]HMS00733.1 ATP-binding protein [Anaerolineales bacterium]HNQ93153.1 ATP-binding protein [Anaerolineales bacterium]HNS59401.1 ATP-binding protein [Anaerolineales bacterium]